MNKKLLVGMLFGIVLSACGGGGSNSSPPPVLQPPPPDPIPPTQPPAPTKPQYFGAFEGFWVQGLGFKSTSVPAGRLQIGPSDGRNLYLYSEGDSLTFNFGSLVLPSVPAVSQTLFFEIFGTRNQRANEILNFMRLVLTVVDQPPELGKAMFVHQPWSTPSIPEVYASTSHQVYVTLADLGQPPDQFETSPHVAQFLAAAGKPALASRQIAFDYWIESMQYALLNFDGDSQVNANDDDDDNDGVLDESDAFPWDADEQLDANDDGIGDTANTQYFKLAFAPYTGTGSTLPFNLHDFAFHPAAGRLFVTNQVDGSLSVFDVDTGALLKKLTFGFETQKVAFNADRSKLYLLLLDHPPGTHTPAYNERGRVAVIDTQQLTQIRAFDLSIAPFDLVVIGDDRLVISSGYDDQLASMYVFDAQSGALLSSVFPASEGAFLSLEPTRNWVFAHGISRIAKYEVVGTTLVDLNVRNDSPVSPGTNIVIQPEGDGFMTPAGTRLVTTNGIVYDTETLSMQGWLPDWVLGIDFPGDGTALVSGPGNAINRYPLANLMLTQLMPFDDSTPYNSVLFGKALLWGQPLLKVYTRGDYLYVVQTKADGQLQLVRKRRPS